MSADHRDVESVLVPTQHDPSRSYPTMRSLASKGINTVVASENAHPPVFASRFCDERHRVPAAEDDLAAYRDGLLELAAREDVRTAVPLREEDAYVFSRYYDAFDEHLDLVVPPLDALERVHDRMLLAEAAEAAGVPAPETRPLDEVDDWSGGNIVKSRYNLLTDAYVDSYPGGEAGKEKDVIHLRPGETPDVDELCDGMSHVPIVQECVPKDDEYMFAGLYDHGEPLATFQHRQIRGDSYVGGGGVYRKSVSIPELERVARDLLSELDWHGLACIEYMEHAETGEFVLTEINPRMWQSLPATIHAGADFPHYYWLQATGRADEIDPGYDLGTGSHSPRGELVYLASLLTDESPYVDRPGFLRTVGEMLASFYRQPHFDYTHIDDPVVFVSGFGRMIRNRLK
ncbi:carboxylate--amine ligase [Halorarum halobium]|uniref:carboxylate--amine ligase n=1 Tax=Halorarum halobium TaxID=3075121 RepID=UPI0028A6FE7E|nr:carboxylate--amine ligase [Halobaculum sp. XH14]